jgi:hypothetical protein
VAGGLLRSMLPIEVPAQSKNKGERLACDKEIRLFSDAAKQIQRYDFSGGDQADQQTLRLLDRGRTGCGVAAPHAGFDERRSGRRQLGLPRQVKAQGMLFDPALCLLEGQDGILLLAPVCRPCCLELLFCHLAILSGWV